MKIVKSLLKHPSGKIDKKKYKELIFQWQVFKVVVFFLLYCYLLILFIISFMQLSALMQGTEKNFLSDE